MFGIRAKLLITFVAIVLPLIALIIAVSHYNLRITYRALRGIVAISAEIQAINKLQLEIDAILMPGNDYIITGKRKYIRDFIRHSKDLKRSLKELELLLAHREAANHSEGVLGKEREMFRKVRASWHHIRKISTKIFAIRNPVGSVEAARLMEEMDYTWAYPAISLLGQWSMAAVKEYINTEKAANIAWKKASVVTYLISGAILFLDMVFVFFISTRMVRPILTIRDHAKTIASGDFKTMLDLKTGDEIQQVSIAINEMTAHLDNLYSNMKGMVIEKTRDIELLQTTTMAIAESEDLYSALVVVLRNVCNTTGWDYGEAWLPSPDGKQLQHSQAWYSSLADMEEFTNQSKKFTFPPGIGLPGSVWSSKKPQWRRNVNTDTSFLRAQIADKYGLKAAMGIPVLADKKVVAVLCFFLRQQREEDERLLMLVSVTAAQLGSVIQRNQAEEALKKSMNGLEQYSREISLLSEMDSMLETCVTTQEAYTVIAGCAERLFPNDSGTLYVHNVTLHIMEAVAEWGILHKGERIFALDNCWALRRGQIFAADTSHAGLTCKHVDHSVKTCHLCLPITAQGEVLGLFYVQGNPDKPDMHESKQLLATTIAEHISLFLSNLKLREILRDQSIKDPLTSLFNRRYMLESLGRELHKAARNQSHLGIIMLDIDHFKRFNDTFGHEAGDTVLRELSAFLLSHIRGSDIACRYGGEEFVIVLPETTLENTTQRAGHIREKIKHLPMQHGGKSLGIISVSLGVAIYPNHGITSEALLRAADAALYRAKSEGRDRVVVWQQTNDKL